MAMNKMNFSLFCVCLVLAVLCACSVTDNLYVNNPVPAGKGNYEVFGGIGTGIRAKTDSVSDNGNIYASGKTVLAPVLSIGAQAGLLKHMDLRAALYLPYVIGGVGGRIGTQYSLFDSASVFNAALGTDFSFSFAKDSLTLFGSTSALNPDSKGSLSFAFFLPFSYRLSEHALLILTPRYSFNSFYFHENKNTSKSNRIGIKYPSLTLGFRIKSFYLESSALFYNHTVYPHGGIVWYLP